MQWFKKYHHLRYFSLWVIFLFVSFIIYSQILDNFFASDDFHWLVIARDSNISLQTFFTNYEGGNNGGSYNPLLVIIFKFFYNLFHTNYFGYHLVSIFLHSINTLLVFVLSEKVFKISSIKKKSTLAFLAALLFLIYPVHTEIIAWIAAWPHLWVTPFYLLSLINYFTFKQKNKAKNLFYSFLFFIIALLIKEIAVSLPFIILVWEIYFNNKKSDIKHGFSWLVYFLFLAFFFSLRYLSTGLFFGTYSNHHMGIDWQRWLVNLFAFGTDFVSFGFFRSIVHKGIYHYTDSVVIIVLAFLALYLFYILSKKKNLEFIYFFVFLFSLVPVLVLGLHPTTFGGERYLYLASIFFIIWILFVFSQKEWSKKSAVYLFVSFFILSLTVTGYKLSIWNDASKITRQIVDSYQDLDIEPGQKLIRAGMPDNLEGAEVFRNNLNQALEIYYPDSHPEIIPTLAYLQINKENKNKKLLKWRQDEKGWFAESVDGSFVVTGVTSITMNNIYWELWNYNYQSHKANIIRLMPNDNIFGIIKAGEIKILIFDQGKLEVLEWYE